jgi:hypothetical protein
MRHTGRGRTCVITGIFLHIRYIKVRIDLRILLSTSTCFRDVLPSQPSMCPNSYSFVPYRLRLQSAHVPKSPAEMLICLSFASLSEVFFSFWLAILTHILTYELVITP